MSEPLLERAVDAILPSRESLEAALATAQSEGRQLRGYLGIDPTSPHLHIGHTIPMRNLARWQRAGQKAILLIGDFTARLGDPDKLSIRQPLTKEQVASNMATYLDQVGRILELDGENPVEIRYNSEWSEAMTFAEVVQLASNFTVSQMLERDMFQQRMKEQKPISLSEFFYPLMQGYDAVALEADVQFGGTDQLFNMLAGRTLNRALAGREMWVITSPLLADRNGVKIGKTMGNAINIDNPANILYGQIMSLPDEVIIPGLQLLTDIRLDEIDQIATGLQAGDNPMEAKKKLAHTVVEQFHSRSAAEEAQSFFARTVQRGEVDQDAEDRVVDQTAWDVLDLLLTLGLVDSKNEARRLFDQSAIELNGQRLTERHVTIDQPIILKVGKRQFVRVRTGAPS